jgi:uncharacterized membrane protein YozB (DUF420 family)
MSVTDLPGINALLNTTSMIFLILGYRAIRKDRRLLHKRWMLSALSSSALFLISYVIYHYHVGSVPYMFHDWTRSLYFIILVPHIVFAGVMTPFILIAVWLALHEKFEKHVRLVRWVWPVWMYVSVSGIIIYLMLYQHDMLF